MIRVIITCKRASIVIRVCKAHVRRVHSSEEIIDHRAPDGGRIFKMGTHDECSESYYDDYIVIVVATNIEIIIACARILMTELANSKINLQIIASRSPG